MTSLVGVGVLVSASPSREVSDCCEEEPGCASPVPGVPSTEYTQKEGKGARADGVLSLQLSCKYKAFIK